MHVLRQGGIVTPRHPDTDRRRNAIIVATGGVLREGAPELGGTHRAILAANIADAVLALAGLRLPAEHRPLPYNPDFCVQGHQIEDCPTPEPPAEPDYNPHPNPFDENGDFLDGEFDEDGNPASVPEAVTPDLRARLAGTLDEVSFPLPNGTRGVEMRDALVAVDAALDATPPPALDVERLTQAYTNIEGAGEWTPNGRIASGWVAGRVAAIAREYARLATSTDNH
jgi:hypothetical protein